MAFFRVVPTRARLWNFFFFSFRVHCSPFFVVVVVAVFL